MELGRNWKVLTSFGWVKIHVYAPTEARPTLDATKRAEARSARFHLLYELGANLSSVPDSLGEVWRFFSDRNLFFVNRDGAPTDAERHAFGAMLDAGVDARQLELEWEPFWMGPLSEHAYEGPIPQSLPPSGPTTQHESFIAANLVDQKGRPVVGRRWSIELPDGSKREGRTDDDGWARVTGFTKDGGAKIVFPEFDELDLQTRVASERVIIPVKGDAPEDAANAGEAPSEDSVIDAGEGDHFVELCFVDPAGAPLADVSFSLKLANGKVVTATSSANGVVKVVGVEAGSATLELPDVHATDWQLEAAKASGAAS